MVTSLHVVDPTVITGAKGGGSSRTPVEAPDSLRSTALARILDLVSEGPIGGLVHGLQSVYLDETPLANADGTLNFKNVSVEYRSGTQDQEYIPGFPDVENETRVAMELRQETPWTRGFSNTQLSALRIRLSVPALSKVNTSNGDTNGHTVAYLIEVSTDGGPFELALSSAFSGKTTSKYERSHRIDLPPAEEGWTVRVRRTTANMNTGSVQDLTFVEAFTEIVDAKLRYPNSALVGIVVDAEQFPNIPVRSYDLLGRIVRVPSNYDAATRTYTGTWDGTFKPSWTDNPAWIFYDLVTNARFGLGHLVSADLVDKWGLYKIARYCDGMVPDGNGGVEPRFTCNVYLQTRADAYKVLGDLASAFRGMTYWASGAITSVADMPGDPAYIYTAANVIDGKFTYQGSSRKARHTVALVSWNDMSDFGRAKVEYVEDQEGIDRYGVQQIEVTAVGCTSRSQARRLGRWILFSERYETDTVNFEVGLDGAVAAPGQLILVGDELRAGRRIGGRIASASNTKITVDKAVQIAAGDRVTVVMPDATTQTRTVSLVESEGKELTVNPAFTGVPQPESMFVIQSDELHAQTFRVISVGEGTGFTYQITALQHATGKYAEIEEGIPYEEPNIIDLPPKAISSPTNLIVQRREIAGAVVAGTAVHISWDVVDKAVSYEVEYRQGEGSWQLAGRTGENSYDIYGLVAGTFECRVAAITATGVYSTPTRSEVYYIPDTEAKPGVIIDLENTTAEQERKITQEIVDRINADHAETQARNEALAQEAADRVAALQAESQARTEAIEAEALARAQALLDQKLAVEAAIAAEQTIRQTMDESLASAISNIVAGTGEQFDPARVWYFDTDLEAWSGVGGAASVANGYLKLPNGVGTAAESADDLGIDGNVHKYVKVRMKRTGSPAWVGKLQWQVEGDSDFTEAKSLAVSEPIFEIDGDSSIDFKDISWSGTLKRIRLSLVQEQTDTDRIDIDWIAVGRPSPGASVAALQEESLARIAGDAAEATQRTTLASQIRGNYDGTDIGQLSSGLLFAERQARTSADEAIATDVTNLQARITDAEGEIAGAASAVTELSTRVTNAEGKAEAASSAVTDLTSRVGNAEAALVNELITRANKDATIAGSLNLIETRMVDAEGKVEAAAQTATSYENRLSTAEGKVSSQASAITGLQTKVTNLETTAEGLNNTISGLDSRVDDVEGTITAQGQSITSLQSSLSTKPQTFVQPNEPPSTGRQVGDLWIDTDRKNLMMVWNGSAWIVSSDNNNIMTFVQASAPTATNVGDLWFDSDDNNRQYRWNGSQWIDISDARTTANASAISTLTTRVSNAEGTLTSQASSITTLRTDVNGNSASISSHASSINGLMGKAGLSIDVNGRVVGWTLNNNGWSGTMDIVADKFRLTSPTGGARTEYSDGNWRVYDANGVLRVRMGIW